MNKDEIIKILDEALLNDEEMKNPENWKYLNDPLPRWEVNYN
jgi:hypothetical protein